VAACAAGALLALAACCRAAATDAPPDPAVIAADNAFGLKLLESLPPDADGNKVISPLSIAMAMQIVYNGAQGETRRAMAAALQLGSLGAQDINAANQALQTVLANPGPQNQLTLANSLWVRHGGRDINPQFTQINQSYYAAHIGDLEGAPDNVNAWVSDVTRGRITQLMSRRDYRDAVAIIANAIYFKGHWSDPFDPSRTLPDQFKPESGPPVNCFMMRRRARVPYFESPEFDAIRLAYGDERRLGMLILLPNAGHSVASVASAVTADTLKQWRSHWRGAEVDVSLPRFKVSYAQSLPGALSALGMGVAFDPNRSDFSGIAPHTVLSDVEHAALVQADESGTTAAAATGITAVVTSVQREPIAFKVDHPFFFAILDEASGALLFAGTVSNPS
jgi:serpin B